MIRYRKLSSFSQCLLKGSQNARVTLASIEGGGSEACVAGGLLLRLPHLSSPRPIHPNPSTDVQKHEQFNDVREFEKQYSSPSIIKQSHENLDIQKSAHLPHSFSDTAALYVIEKMTYNDKNPAVDGSDKQRDSLQGRLDKLLGAVQVKAGREGIFYSGVVVPEDLPQMMTIIRDSVVGTCITAADLSETEAIAEYEVAELIGKPDLLLPELTHTTAFYGTQYHGEHKSIDEIVHPNSILSVPQGLKTLDAGNINKFWRRSLQADDTTAIAVGAGISLKDFMHQCGNHISEIFKPSSPSSILTGSTGNYDHLDTSNTNHVELEYQKNNDFTSTSKATPKQLKYIGGTAYYEIAEEHLLHISIAFNGLPATASTKDTIAFATLQMLLGGGNAFSAGGPGKGMYSRLYQRVLNRHHWIESCRVFAHSYASCGLFGIHASAPPSHARDLAKVVVAQIRDSAEGPMSIEEVDRARNQVKSAVLMGLESRVAQVEQLAEQVAFNQEYLTPAQICERVDAIKAVDLQEAAQKMIQSNPTIIAYGPIQALPSQDVIRKWLL